VEHAANTVSGSHIYAEAGVYTINLTVTDSFPGSGALESDFGHLRPGGRLCHRRRLDHVA
jgi:hypothetical protein